MIKFQVLGPPVAQGRPRASSQRGKIIMRDPKKSKEYKQYVKLAAAQYAPEQLLDEPLHLIVKVFRPIPKSFSKKKTQEAITGVLRPITKPDTDNYLKGVKDALNGVIWRDDSIIVDTSVSKYYSDKPRIEVEVYTLEEIGA
jgi:Holliday junction resolvase RusA-like endonuclease